VEERSILVFDICSSTIIVEELIKTNQIKDYNILVYAFRQYLNYRANLFHFTVYKFLGDGFIIIFDENKLMDHILIFVCELTKFVEEVLKDFVYENIEIGSIPRIGITMGLDHGVIVNFFVNGHIEYTGRPLNFACRLQSSLTEKEHVNKLLLSLRVKKELKSSLFRQALKERERVFRNISRENRIRCFEFDPALLSNSDKNQILKDYPLVRRVKIKQPTPQMFDEQRKLFQESEEYFKKLIKKFDF